MHSPDNSSEPRRGDLLIEGIDVLATMDEDSTVLHDGWILLEGNSIAGLGRMSCGAPSASERIDASGHMVLPGLVNTHHHFFQNLLRCVPPFQESDLLHWLSGLSRAFSSITEEMIEVSSRVAIAELMLSGCTTTLDHAYIPAQGRAFDIEIDIARRAGIRFHLARGFITEPGDFLSSDSAERVEDVLESCQRLIGQYHDPQPLSMTRVEIAPTSAFSVSTELLCESAGVARSLGVRLHTHCSETAAEVDLCMQTTGLRPTEHLASLGFNGPDVCLAHGVHLDQAEIGAVQAAGTAIAHCPSSNMRLGSGIAPVREFLDRSIPVGLGVDGSASNDGSHLLAEARLALLGQRALNGANSLSPMQALELATWRGAEALGRQDLGRIAPGLAGDLIGIPIEQLCYAGATTDPIAGLTLCQPGRIGFSVIDGEVRVMDGQLIGWDLESLIRRQNSLSLDLLERIGMTSR